MEVRASSLLSLDLVFFPVFSLFYGLFDEGDRRLILPPERHYRVEIYCLIKYPFLQTSPLSQKSYGSLACVWRRGQETQLLKFFLDFPKYITFLVASCGFYSL